MTSPSFKGVNYSLRPSKSIQRGLIFEGLRRLSESLDWAKATYVGLGSIWFTDFVMAHRTLRITRMVSIEAHPIGFKRAYYNRPYSFVRMKEGLSYDIVPQLYEEARFPTHPAIIWLDYDAAIDIDKLDELRFVVENATDDTVLLVTFDASERHYGNEPQERIEQLRDLFGALTPSPFKRRSVTGTRLADTLADLVESVLVSQSNKIRKTNACIPAFKLIYQDKATMVTVGAVFPSVSTRADARRHIRASDWPGFVMDPIVAPHLTSIEAAALQANLPLRGAMTRDMVQSLGFDLEEDQIAVFQQFYRHYPTFAQIVG